MEKCHIVISKTKTPKTTSCHCPNSENTTLHESHGILSALLKSRDRGESQYTFELGEANSNTAMLRQIEQAALWDRLIVGVEERRRQEKGWVSITLSV